MTPKELENLKEAYESIREGVRGAIEHVKEHGSQGDYLTALNEVLQMFDFHDSQLGLTEETPVVSKETYEQFRDKIINKYSGK